ncbi:alpha/beta hydrolase [Flavobacterium chungnamense]|uniref:Alpha/beta hydrolase-fold protein n=1 Tax=Flavobacterium chungnamense TaxID=706182 RepID=A0ABP7V4Y5_9FLAO
MNKNLKIIIFYLLIASSNISAQIPKVTNGSIQRFENFKSQYVDAHNIDVWLPDGYSDQEKYAVLYMHDGNMLYDAQITWNKQSWEVDEVAGRLIADSKTQKFIVVGIWNNNEYRHSEYFPQKIIKDIPEATRKIIVEEQLLNKPQADNYLKFIVKELKPFIDKKFSTKKNQKNTFIAGSSMGGLISLYAICEYPKVFGGAACLSTHTPMIMKEKISQYTDIDVASKFREYLIINLPNPKKHKIYFDYGDQTLDSFYKPFQEKIDLIMIEKGYTSKNWLTKFFPGKDHSEKAWHERLDIPLLFLLKK